MDKKSKPCDPAGKKFLGNKNSFDDYGTQEASQRKEKKIP